MKKIVLVLLLLLLVGSVSFILNSELVSADPTETGALPGTVVSHGTLTADFGSGSFGEHPWGGEE